MYRLYADYALKVCGPLRAATARGAADPGLASGQNPFYEVDMPIRCELFDKSLERMVKGGV